MKKFLSVLLALISILCLSFAFGCGEEKDDYGQFYSLQNAYGKGLISKDDLIRIAAINNGEDQCTETLDGKTELLIKNCEAERLRNYSNHPITEAEASGIEIVRFYGKYSGCYAVSLENIYTANPTDVPDRSFYVDGVYFEVFGYLNISIWTLNN